MAAKSSNLLKFFLIAPLALMVVILFLPSDPSGAQQHIPTELGGDVSGEGVSQESLQDFFSAGVLLEDTDLDGDGDGFGDGGDRGDTGSGINPYTTNINPGTLAGIREDPNLRGQLAFGTGVQFGGSGACDQDGDGVLSSDMVCGGRDCNDTNPTIYRGAIEVCDGKDNNCNRIVDEHATCHRSCEPFMRVVDLAAEYDDATETTTLTWKNSNSEKLNYYYVYYSKDRPFYFSRLAKLDPTQTTYTHDESGMGYIYNVVSIDYNNYACAYAEAIIPGGLALHRVADQIVIADMISVYPSKYGVKPFSVQFDIESFFNTNYTYTWEYGDGTMGEGRTPVHTFQASGAYDVLLHEKGENGHYLIYTIRLFVTDPVPLEPRACTVADVGFEAIARFINEALTADTKDSDGDGLTDREELCAGTSPFDQDTDNDGYLDMIEITRGYAAATDLNFRFQNYDPNSMRWAKQQMKWMRYIFTCHLLGELGELAKKHSVLQSVVSEVGLNAAAGAADAGAGGVVIVDTPGRGFSQLPTGAQSIGQLRTGGQSIGQLNTGAQSIGQLNTGAQSIGQLRSGAQSIDQLNTGAQSIDQLRSGSQGIGQLPTGATQTIGQIGDTEIIIPRFSSGE